MNRFDFIHSIDYNDFSPRIINIFFDQLMLLYDTMQTISYNCIDIINISDNDIVFSIQFINDDDAILFFQQINKIKNEIIVLYGRNFIISSCDIDKNRIIIHIIY